VAQSLVDQLMSQRNRNAKLDGDALECSPLEPMQLEGAARPFRQFAKRSGDHM
jgi:hypothetical protein